MHWTTEFYRLVDGGDPQLARFLAPDISVKVGNHAETRGVGAMMAGELGRHAIIAPTSTHEFLNIWDLDGDTAALESIVTYHRTDGVGVTVPAVTIVHRNEQQLIDSLRLFIDTTPLFQGLSHEQAV